MKRDFPSFSLLAKFLRRERGAAAAEVAIWAVVIIVPLLSAADLAFFTYRRMQVDLGAQAGVAAVWASCDTAAKLPAVQKCTGIASTISTAVQSTSLGTSVTVSSGYPIEGYYCAVGGALVAVGTQATTGGTPTPPSPFNCAAAGGSSLTKPGDYLRVQVAYTFTPTFSAVPVATLLPTAVTRSAWTRLN